MKIRTPVPSSLGDSLLQRSARRSLAGEIAVLDNTKPGFAEVANAVLEALVGADATRRRGLYVTKGNPTRPAEEPDYERLSSGAVAVLVGAGDCGACTSWSVYDAVELANRGVWTVYVCTEIFAPLARSIAEPRNRGNLDIVVIPHPLAASSEELGAAALTVASRMEMLATSEAA
jgi:hypothetical protein